MDKDENRIDTTGIMYEGANAVDVDVNSLFNEGTTASGSLQIIEALEKGGPVYFLIKETGDYASSTYRFVVENPEGLANALAAIGLSLDALAISPNIETDAPGEVKTDTPSEIYTYTATGKGISGDVPVTVEIGDGRIISVAVGENSETQGIGSKAIEQLPALIVEANGTEGVDGVSGASITSKAIFSAVEDCLAQAASGETVQTDEAEGPVAEESGEADAAKGEEAPAAEVGAYADGTYVASGKGIGGKVPVTVEVKDGKVAEVKVGDNSETQGIGSKAIEQLPELIVEANGTEGVDGVSGATITSKAIFTAVEDCLKQAEAPADEAKADDKADKKDDAKAEAGSLKDGTYEAEGKGIGGKVPVTVKVKDGKISEVKVGDNSETQGIGSKAIEQLPALIVEAGGTEGVDGVSGASITSKAIFSAVEDCLEQASAQS